MKSRLRFSDVLRLGWGGLGSRRGRATMTALGIAVGTAAIVAVTGISASGRADLLAALDRLGTNLLRVSAGQGLFGGPARLPDDSAAMAARIGPVEAVSAVASVNTSVRRSDLIRELETGGLGVVAVQPDLVDLIGAQVEQGRFIDAGSAALPVAVLGRVAAERLGVPDLDHDRLVYLGEQWFTVIGILAELPLHPDLERAALIGRPAAERFIDPELALTTIYVRVAPTAVNDVVKVISATVNPESPTEVEVVRPSDALAAREAAEAALTQLLVGLGSVALLVGGIAIANIMAMSVLERRMEIGIRRALGATKRHIGLQFLTEAVLLAAIGGVAGVVLGAAITIGFVMVRGLVLALPVIALGGALGAALVIGAVAGIYPATRAARVSPAEAVKSA